jgi:tripartite-type tricarboxylate transporter receptor subunit TctC
MKFSGRLLVSALAVILFATAVGPAAHAQTWPARPIILVIGFPAGGSTDIVGRPFAEFASKELGQPVVVENRTGNGGVTAGIGVVRSAPDGYTIILQASGPMILRPIMDHTTGYDPVKDFTPIALFGETPNVILGGTKFPTQSLREVTDWAKKNPGALTIGHPGPGTVGHLAALLWASKTGFTGNYIAYRGAAQMVTDILGGHIDAAVGAYAPPLKAAHILAVMSPERVDFLPDVPSAREAGFPGVYASTWFALFGPPHMPPEIVKKLNTVLNAFLRSEATRKQFSAIGFQGIGGSPEKLAKQMAEDTVVWTKVIRDAHITMDAPK